MFVNLSPSSYGKEQIVNENFALQAAINRGVIDRSLSTPPEEPISEGVYIPIPTATGAWTGKEHRLMWWNSVNKYWHSIIPNNGMRVNSQKERTFLRYESTPNRWVVDIPKHLIVEEDFTIEDIHNNKIISVDSDSPVVVTLDERILAVPKDFHTTVRKKGDGDIILRLSNTQSKLEAIGSTIKNRYTAAYLGYEGSGVWIALGNLFASSDS